MTQQPGNTLSTDVKLTFGKRLAYAVGDLGYNCMYFWVSAYLMIFYTDVFGISAMAVTTLMLVVRIFDALNDPFIGSLADRTKQKTGTYKPWLIWGPITLGISITLLFWAHASWPTVLKYIYVYATYIVVVCASTATNMPYGVLTQTLTTDVQERSKISSLRFACCMMGNMVVTVIAAPLLIFFGLNSGHAERSYLVTVALFCALSVPMFLITAFRSKEVVLVPESQSEKLTMGDRMRCLKSAPILIMITVMLFHGFVYYGRAAIYPYYFTYLCGSASMIASFGIIQGIANILGTIISPYIHRFFRHKGHATIFDVGVFAVCTGLIYFFPPTQNIVAFYALTFIGGLGFGAYMVMLYSMIPDAIDYSQLKSGVSASGFLYALTSFTCKVGGALAPAVLALVFNATGYVPNVVQNGAVLTSINLMMSVVPGAVGFIYLVVMAFYKISDREYHVINAELAKVRGTAIVKEMSHLSEDQAS